MITVTFTHSCDQCHKTILLTEEASPWADYLTPMQKGWRWVRNKQMHSIEMMVCEECQEKLHPMYELYD